MIGGGGAGPSMDGVHGCDPTHGFLRNTPIESIEADVPIVMRRYDLIPDSGGPGRHRAGMAIRMDFQVFHPDAIVTARGQERFKIQPWGVGGGTSGTAGATIVNPDGPEPRDIGKIDYLPLRPGDIVSIRAPAGGGHGDPLERDPELVVTDVRAGLVSAGGGPRGLRRGARDGAADEAATARAPGGDPRGPAATERRVRPRPVPASPGRAVAGGRVGRVRAARQHAADPGARLRQAPAVRSDPGGGADAPTRARRRSGRLGGRPRGASPGADLAAAAPAGPVMSARSRVCKSCSGSIPMGAAPFLRRWWAVVFRASPAAAYVAGQVLPIDGGLTA